MSFNKTLTKLQCSKCDGYDFEPVISIDWDGIKHRFVRCMACGKEAYYIKMK